MLNSSKAKTGDSGNKYIDVPFRVKPTSKEPVGQVTKDIRTAVANILKSKNVTKKIEEYNKNSKGLSKYGTVTRYGNIHRQHPAHGLVKITAPNKKAGGRYFLFRRISEKSSSNSWMHPGYQGIHLFDDVLPSFADKKIDEVLRKILG
jgi:hypothetical protein